MFCCSCGCLWYQNFTVSVPNHANNRVPCLLLVSTAFVLAHHGLFNAYKQGGNNCANVRRAVKATMTSNECKIWPFSLCMFPASCCDLCIYFFNKTTTSTLPLASPSAIWEFELSWTDPRQSYLFYPDLLSPDLCRFFQNLLICLFWMLWSY